MDRHFTVRSAYHAVTVTAVARADASHPPSSAAVFIGRHFFLITWSFGALLMIDYGRGRSANPACRSLLDGGLYTWPYRVPVRLSVYTPRITPPPFIRTYRLLRRFVARPYLDFHAQQPLPWRWRPL